MVNKVIFVVFRAIAPPFWIRPWAGRAIKELRAMEACKKQTNRYQLCLFLRSNNVDLKNNSITYRKPL